MINEAIVKMIIRNIEVIDPDQPKFMGNVVIENGKITGIYKEVADAIPGEYSIDGNGKYLCPGFIDLHFHGARGVDTMDSDADSFAKLSKYCSEFGVTSFYPTTWANSSKHIMQVLESVKQLTHDSPGARLMGIHLEGPYLNPDYRGAQDVKMLSIPLEDDYFKWFETGVVKLVTCAPELPGAADFTKEAIRRNIRISIGHSGASFDQVHQAAEMGVTQATHLFNGMGGIHHREPGTAGGILDDDRIYAQVICDGIHLHPAIIRLIHNVKSSKRTILITDSIIGAGLPDGVFENNGNAIVISNGIARNRSGGLAGSRLTMDVAIKNMMAFTGLPLENVIPMATSTPAEVMGIADRKGRIAPGYDADLVILDQDLRIEKTIVGGRSVYSR